MRLELDQRRRAMLREMGVRVWLPPPGAAQASLATGSAPAPVLDAALAVRAPVTTGVKPDTVSPDRLVDLAHLPWPELHQAIMKCQLCKQSLGRRRPVFVPAQPGPVDWLVLSEPPDQVEEGLGQAVAAQAGLLLDNMLRAVAATRLGGEITDMAQGAQSRAYVSNVVKCRPAIARNPDADDLSHCETYLRREVGLLQPRVILAMGRLAAQSLLQDELPEVAGIALGKLRGRVYRYQGIPVVVSYPLSYLLRTPAEKARVWLDLCLARQQFE